jgi:hypothetical protein
MRFLVWAFRALVVLFVARLVMRLFARAGRSRMATPRPNANPRERLGGTLVRCAACGTHVPEHAARTTGSGQSARHFCSSECQQSSAA